MLSICFAYNSVHLRELGCPITVPFQSCVMALTRIGLERWYIAVSLFTAFFVPIVPTILGHFGADPVYASWYVYIIPSLYGLNF